MMAMDDSGKPVSKPVGDKGSGMLANLPGAGVAQGCLGASGCLGGLGCLGCLPVLIMVPVVVVGLAWGALGGSSTPRYLQRELNANRPIAAQRRCQLQGLGAGKIIDQKGNLIGHYCGKVEHGY